MSADRVILWRHGRTGHNHSGTWQGQLDVPLDDVGRAQASAAAAVLAGLVGGDRSVTLVSSDLSRARDTAIALASALGVEVALDQRLREIDAGRWQGLTRAEIAAAGMGQELDAWLGGEDVRPGGGERRSEAALRCAAAVREHADAMESGTLVVAGHGGVLRGSIITQLGLPPEHWHLFGVLGNAHWAELAPARTPGAPWRLVSYNVSSTVSSNHDVSHNVQAAPATPANRFEVLPPAQGRLTEPRQ